jgi:hypothetical protein
MDALGKPFVVANRTESGIKERLPHGLMAFTTRHVCGDCNSGWMSRLEGAFCKHLGVLVEPTWPANATPIIYAASDHGEMIGKWALKILVCMGVAGINAKTVPEYVAHEFNSDDGKLPTDFFVRLGHLRTPGMGTIITRGIQVRRGRELHWQEHKDGEAFKAVIALNHLAVGISRAPHTKPSFVAWEGSLPVMAYPEREKTERQNYSFSDVASFERSFEFEVVGVTPRQIGWP